MKTTLGLLVIIVLLCGYILYLRDNAVTAHKCFSPCAVTLPDNTLEDQFKLDYGWLDNDTPVVDIYR